MKYSQLNIGHRFSVHVISVTTKVKNEKVNLQIRYIRESQFVQEMDEIDDYILQSVKIKFPKAKNKAKVYTKNNRNLQPQFLLGIAGAKHEEVDVLLIQERQHEVGGGNLVEFAQISFPIDIYYRSVNMVDKFGITFSKLIFVNEKEWNTIPKILGKSYSTFKYFFS